MYIMSYLIGVPKEITKILFSYTESHWTDSCLVLDAITAHYWTATEHTEFTLKRSTEHTEHDPG